MRISEFVDQIVIRFDSKLGRQDQVDAFRGDCNIHLKKFEGEILGFAFHEIVYKRKFASHPKIAEIVKVCNAKLTTDHKKVNPVSKEQEQWRVSNQMADEFQKTDAFKWAAERMIGWDVVLFIRQKGRHPINVDIEKMLKSHEEFKKTMSDLESNMELSVLQRANYKMGQGINEKNLMYLEQMTR